ncbi:MAG: hypothetical protein E7488_07055 [Ruminococcaceae bacterium]|nr:hypothetical protein [Oscillospiraceae bacterium]
MTEKRKRKKHNMFFPVLTVVLLLVFFVMQWYLINRNKIETVKANEGYINDSIISMGIICRDEIVMESDTDGYFYYNVKNGDRVSSGMLVGEVYSSQKDLDLIYRSEDIESQIAKLKEAENFMSSVNVDISITRRELSNSMAKFAADMSSGSFAEVYGDMIDMSLHLNKINAAMNREGDIAATIAEMENLNDDVKSQITSPMESVYSPSSGYFVSYTDGYEDIADARIIGEMSYSAGKKILESITTENKKAVYGKVITNYKWDLCTYVKKEQAEKLYEGQNVKVSVDIEENQYHNVTVEKIVPKDEMVLVVLNSSTMNKNIVEERITDCEILFNQYKGIKVPVEAIRFVDGQQGVYVKFSKLVQFKKVKPVYQDANYAILPLGTDEENQVELYDNIIVKGVNLYDGKYL